MEFNIEERKQNPLFELHSANVAECSISFLAIILVVCVNQNFLNNKHFLFVIATIPENFVPLLEVQESREDELVSGAAPLSYPVGHLNITSMGLCPALLCCPTLWATSVSQVWVCVRRCSAVLPCRSPQYHKYGSVYDAARLSYPVGHLNITSVDWDADFVTADNAYSRYIHSRPRSQLCVRVPSCTLIGSTVLQVVLFSLSAPAA